MLRNKKGSLLIIILSVFLLLLAGCGQAEENNPSSDAGPSAGEGNSPIGTAIDFDVKDSKVIAKYDDGQVNAGEFEKYLNVQSFINQRMSVVVRSPEVWEPLLKRYISEQIFSKEADDEGQAKEEADQAIEQVREQLGEEKLADNLNKLNITEEDLRAYLIRARSVGVSLRSKITDQDVQQTYDDNKDKGIFTVISVRHILIMSNEDRSMDEAKVLAEELAGRIRSGEDFAELAKEYSDDGGSKDNGGLYPDVPYDQQQGWVTPFKEAALQLEVGKVSDPIEVNSAGYKGYHVMRVEKREVLPLDQVRDQVEIVAMNQQYQQFVDEELDKKIDQLDVPKKLKS